jgi:hypothetical protein
VQVGHLDVGERVMQLSASSRRRRVAVGAVIAGIAAWSVAACNGGTTSFASGGFGESFAEPSGSGGPSPGGPPFPPTAAPICPAAGPPLTGEQCFSSSGLVSDVCEYGGSADPSCNVIARCPADNQGAWTVEQPTHCPTTCPAHFDERVPGATCTGTELCTYLEATCGCAGAIDGAWTTITGGSNNTSNDGGVDASAADGGDGGDGGDARPAAIGRWQCIRPGNGCPARRPVEGAHCTKAMDCDYGTCVFGVPLSLTCINGRWTALFVGSCP